MYRVADRFIEHGLVGLADRREDNGENKVTDAYGMELLRLIEGSPQEHGYRRPTWTQELLVLVLAERTRHSRQRHHDVSAPATVGDSAESAQTDRQLPLAKIASDYGDCERFNG